MYHGKPREFWVGFRSTEVIWLLLTMLGKSVLQWTYSFSSLHHGLPQATMNASMPFFSPYLKMELSNGVGKTSQ